MVKEIEKRTTSQASAPAPHYTGEEITSSSRTIAPASSGQQGHECWIATKIVQRKDFVNKSIDPDVLDKFKAVSAKTWRHKKV